MIKYKKGNLLNVKEGIIAHGCNCQGVMGSGVAKAIREKYPMIYEAYRSRCISTEGIGLLGDVQLISANWDGKSTTQVSPGDSPILLIANCFTQFSYGTNRRQVDYEALAQCFNHLNHASNRWGLTLNIPKIGSGLGGGNWNVISAIIESECKGEVLCWEL